MLLLLLMLVAPCTPAVDNLQGTQRNTMLKLVTARHCHIYGLMSVIAVSRTQDPCFAIEHTAWQMQSASENHALQCAADDAQQQPSLLPLCTSRAMHAAQQHAVCHSCLCSVRVAVVVSLAHAVACN